MWRVWSFERLLLKLKVRRFSEKHFSPGMTGFWSVSDDDHHLQVGYDFPCFFFLGNFYEFNIRNNSWGVKGRFNSAMGFWKTTLNAPAFVLDGIRRGFRLPFAEYPPPCLLPNNKSALAHGCIVEHSVPIFCVNPLAVAEGKKAALSNWFKTR